MSYVPDGPLAVGHVQSLRKTLGQTRAWSEKLRGGVLAEAMLAGPKKLVQQELGIDIDKPDTMKRKGIDPDRDLAFAVWPGNKLTLVVGITDRGAFEKLLREQVQRISAGSASYKKIKHGDLTVTTVLQPNGQQRGGWTFVKKYAIVGALRVGKIDEVLARMATTKASIKSSRMFAFVEKQVGDSEIWAYFDGASVDNAIKTRDKRLLKVANDWMRPALEQRIAARQRAMAFFGAAGLGLRLRGNQAALRFFYSAGQSKRKVVQQLLSGAGEAPSFAKFIGPDAVAVSRLSIDLQALKEMVGEMLPVRQKTLVYRQIEQLEQQNNIDLEKDVFAALAGRYAVALFAPDAKRLGGIPRSAAEVAAIAPLVALVQVKQRDKMADLLARLERFLVTEGREVTVKTVGQHKIYSTAGEGVSWTLTGKDLLLVASGGRLQPTLQLIDKGGDNILGQLHETQIKRILKADDPLLVHADLDGLAGRLRKLDIGMEAKLMAAPVLDALSRIDDVSLWFEPKEEGVVGELSLRLRASK